MLALQIHIHLILEVIHILHVHSPVWGKIHFIMGVYFLTLITDGTYQLWDSQLREEEVYTNNKIYFLIWEVWLMY